MNLRQRFISEFLGTFFLLMIIVGSGIMGETLSQGNVAVALLANSIATGAGLFVLIVCLGPISGAHMNPVVSLVEVLWGRLRTQELFAYWIAQFSGAIVGVIIAHTMFSRSLIEISTKHREGWNIGCSEVIATFGLIAVIGTVGQKKVDRAPASIACYITSAYWFTSSTSFANPAVTLARSLTNTFTGIAPQEIVQFLVAQTVGALMACYLLKKYLN